MMNCLWCASLVNWRGGFYACMCSIYFVSFLKTTSASTNMMELVVVCFREQLWNSGYIWTTTFTLKTNSNYMTLKLSDSDPYVKYYGSKKWKKITVSWTCSKRRILRIVKRIWVENPEWKNHFAHGCVDWQLILKWISIPTFLLVLLAF
jgi:hypothetical protein